jgi:hypothetical protein
VNNHVGSIFSHPMPLKLLRRVYNMLAEVFGHDSEECVATKRKIFALEMKDGGTDVSSTGIVTEISAKNLLKISVGRTKRTSSFKAAAAKRPFVAAMEKKQALRGKSNRSKERPGYRNHIYQQASC